MSCWSCRAPTRHLPGSPYAAVGWSTAVGGVCSSSRRWRKRGTAQLAGLETRCTHDTAVYSEN
eukprot:6132677-Prymnesium_polylepis.1